MRDTKISDLQEKLRTGNITPDERIAIRQHLEQIGAKPVRQQAEKAITQD